MATANLCGDPHAVESPSSRKHGQYDFPLTQSDFYGSVQKPVDKLGSPYRIRLCWKSLDLFAPLWGIWRRHGKHQMTQWRFPGSRFIRSGPPLQDDPRRRQTETVEKFLLFTLVRSINVHICHKQRRQRIQFVTMVRPDFLLACPPGDCSMNPPHP